MIPTSPLVARFDGRTDGKVAWHYGSPLGEQRLTRPMFDRFDRTLIHVAGPDAGTFLTTLFSNVFPAPGDAPGAVWALNLDPQGMILHILLGIPTKEGWLLVGPEKDSSEAEELLTFLQRMVFWNDVTISVAEQWSLLATSRLSPQEQQALPEYVVSCADDFFGSNVVVPVDRLVDLTEHLQGLGFEPAGQIAFDARRVAHVWPEAGVDTMNSIPHEFEMLVTHAVDLNKGCYRGQETVARVHNLGAPPKYGVRLMLDGSDPNLAEPGTPLELAGRRAGMVGTVVHDADFGPVAIGVVMRRMVTMPGLQAGSTAVQVDPQSVPKPRVGAGTAAQRRLKGATEER